MSATRNDLGTRVTCGSGSAPSREIQKTCALIGNHSASQALRCRRQPSSVGRVVSAYHHGVFAYKVGKNSMMLAPRPVVARSGVRAAHKPQDVRQLKVCRRCESEMGEHLSGERLFGGLILLERITGDADRHDLYVRSLENIQHDVVVFGGEEERTVAQAGDRDEHRAESGLDGVVLGRGPNRDGHAALGRLGVAAPRTAGSANETRRFRAASSASSADSWTEP